MLLMDPQTPRTQVEDRTPPLLTLSSAYQNQSQSLGTIERSLYPFWQAPLPLSSNRIEAGASPLLRQLPSYNEMLILQWSNDLRNGFLTCCRRAPPSIRCTTPLRPALTCSLDEPEDVDWECRRRHMHGRSAFTGTTPAETRVGP